MKIRYIKSIIPALAVALTMGIASCVNDLNIGPISPDISLDFSQDEVFAKIYATMALTGQEGPAGNGDVSGIDEGNSAFYRLIFTLNEYPTDEAICSWTDTHIPEMNVMGWGSSNGQVEGLYGRLMYDVTLCNHFLDQTEGLDDEKTARQRAEVRFIRALNYYYLMDVFGNVPFTETVSTELPQQIKRADLFEHIDGELIAIESGMYDPRQAPFGRADKVAVWLLRARMYLNAEVYTGTARWDDAATYAKMVMDSPYELADNYAELFMADNDANPRAMKEIILPIRQDGINTISYGGSLYLIAATHTSGMTPWGTSEGWGGVRARKALVDKFFPNNNAPTAANEAGMIAAAGDDRALFYGGGDRTVEINNTTVFKEGLSVAKWTNVRSDGLPTKDTKWVDTDIPFMRLGEAYLIYAEALFRANNLTDPNGTALATINDLRSRANASALPSISLDQILDERARELYFEGHRRTDLVRYGYFTTNRYMWDWKGGQRNGTAVSSIYNLYPLPVSDLIVNENLVQNPGY